MADSDITKWKTIAIIGIISTLVSVTVNVTKLSDWLRQSSGPRLVTTARAESFLLPPQLLEDVKAQDRSEDRLSSGGGSLEAKYGSLHGLLNVSIRNAGDLEATKVRIQVPSQGLARLEWDDGTGRAIEFKDDIDIGTIELEDSVTVSVWTEDILPEDAESVLLVHQTGRQSLNLSKSKAGGISGFLGSVFATACASAAIVVLAMYRLRRKVDEWRLQYDEKLKEQLTSGQRRLDELRALVNLLGSKPPADPADG